MKAIVIYIENHKGSILQAKQCIKSCKKFGYDVYTLKGCTPNDMKVDFDYPEIEDARIKIFKKENYKKYLAKKACIANQYRIWLHAIKLNEPILSLEHDAIAIKEWDNPEYDEMLVLNMKSAMSRTIFNSTRAPESAYSQEGIRDISESGSKLIYNRNNKYTGSYLPPGLASYVINPQAAKKLIDSLSVDGWEQGDYFVNTSKINIKYTTPDYFKLNENNLLTSHG